MDRAKAVCAKLSDKVVQLTKAVVFLHTRLEGHEASCDAIRRDVENEVQQVSDAAAALVESQRRRVGSTETRRAARLAELERRHAEREREALRTEAELKRATAAGEEAACQRLAQAEGAQCAAVVDARRTAERLQRQLAAAESRARSGWQCLGRQLATEAAQQRRALLEESEGEFAATRKAHARRLEKLRGSREASLAELRAEHDEGRAALLASFQAELDAAVAHEEGALAAERLGLEEQLEAAQEELAAVCRVAAAAKQEGAEGQRELDAMAKELQEPPHPLSA